MKKKKVIGIIALVAMIVLFIFILRNNKQENQQELSIVAQKNEEVAVNVAKVQKEEIGSAFRVNGTFLPETEAQVSAEIGGQLVELYVEQGDEVKPGQVIGRIAGEKINVNLTNAKSTLETAISNLKRYEAAYKTGGVTEAQLDQARLQVENARAQYNSAQLSSGDTRIRTKVGGIVNKKLVEVGSVVGAGTPILEVVDISNLKLGVEVDERLVSELEPGNKVNVTASVLQDTLTGKITFIAPASTGALQFPVEITVDNSEKRLRAGMYGTAIFNRNDISNVLVIPREAFVGSVSQNQVFVVRDSIAYLKEIRSGQNFGGKVEVVGGLEPGDKVVTSGQINLTDSTRVRILQ